MATIIPSDMILPKQRASGAHIAHLMPRNVLPQGLGPPRSDSTVRSVSHAATEALSAACASMCCMTVHDVARTLPGIPALHDLCRSLSMAEAIVNPGGEGRHHIFNRSWSQTEELASMRNGSGDEFDIVFSAAGAYVRGFAHESPLSPYHQRDDYEPWPGVVDAVPAAFQRYVHEPLFTDEDGTPVVTVCLWRHAVADRWETGDIDFPEGHPDPDGTTGLFGLLTRPEPEAFKTFAEDYYETAVSLEALRHIYDLRPLDQAVIAMLSPLAPVTDVVQDALAIGYPISPALRTGPRTD